MFILQLHHEYHQNIFHFCQRLGVPLNLLNDADSITDSMEQTPPGQPGSLSAI